MNKEESKEYQKFKEQCMTMNFLYLTEKYFYCDKENKELHNKIDKAIELLSHFSGCQICEHTQELALKIEEILKGDVDD